MNLLKADQYHFIPIIYQVDLLLFFGNIYQFFYSADTTVSKNLAVLNDNDLYHLESDGMK